MMILWVRLKTWLKAISLLSFVLIYTSLVQANDLLQVREQIKLQEQKIIQQKREQRDLQLSLKAQETQISQVATQMQASEVSLQEIRQSINNTNQQIKQLEKQLVQQKALLAKQLDSAYRINQSTSIVEKLLSNGARQSERMMEYYQHMNKSRLTLIENLKQTQTELGKSKLTILEQQKNEQAQFSIYKKQQQDLKKVQNERQSTLNQLNRNLTQNQNHLNQLRENENTLRNEINRAAQLAQQEEKRERAELAEKTQLEEKKNNKSYQPTVQEKQLLQMAGGLGVARKQYNSPVLGRILNSYGSTQMGEIRWKGIVIGAAEGSAVRAIASGRVIMASWLEGYGLIVVIEHGKGDMSLYGYNQSIAVKVGSYVNAGQTIAIVGSSGGQSRNALYFEIRRQGKTVNPMAWLK